MINLILITYLLSAPPDGTLISVHTPNPHTMIEKGADRLSGEMIHCAVVLDAWVYEATWPSVRRTPWEQWKTEPNRIIYLSIPKQPYTREEVYRMRMYAVFQLGRRYMARGLWEGRETRGIFCSEYASIILQEGGRIRSSYYQETPQSLWVKTMNISKIWVIK